MRYDFPQYIASDARHSKDSEVRAYLWADGMALDERGRVPVFGAVCFRWREWEDAEPSWAAQWVRM